MALQTNIHQDYPVPQRCINCPHCITDAHFPAVFCGNHKREKEMFELLKSFSNQKERYSFGIDLCVEFIYRTGSNPLKPTSPAKPIASCTCMMKLSRFVSLMEEMNYIKVMDTMLRGDKLKQDQIFRAKHLASLVTKKNSTIYMMDGHGRLFFHFCLEIINSKGRTFLDSLKIVLVDCDEKVNDYHKTLFVNVPTVICLQQNIFDVKFEKENIVYLNFCGIGGESGKKELRNFFKGISSYQPLMLSYSLQRGCGLDNGKSYYRTLQPMLKEKGLILKKLPSDRKNFDTVYLSSHGSKVVAKQEKKTINNKSKKCTSELCNGKEMIRRDYHYEIHGNRYKWTCCGSQKKNHPQMTIY